VNAGVTFTEWTSANLTCTIHPTTTAYITVTNLSFPDSGTSNIITFLITDTSGSPITSADYVVQVDTVAPSPPQFLSVSPYQQWTNGAFNMSWTNPVDTSGIGGVYYKLDTAPSTDTDGTLVPGQNITSVPTIPVTSDGKHHIFAWLKDNAGNVNSGNRAARLNALWYDGTPPTTTAVLGGTVGTNGRYSSAVTVTLFGIDASSGVSYTTYLVDGGPWLTYTVPFTVSGNGDHTVDYYSVDKAGNTEGVVPTTFKIGPAMVYLPLVLRNYYPPTPTPTPTPIPTPRLIQNPSFEDGLNYWQTVGVVVHSSEWKTNGQYSARLGDPGYRCDGGGVVGKNGVTQTFNVPTTGSTTLALDYKIVTQDSLLEAGDYLQIEINGSSVQKIGWQQAASGCLGQPNIMAGTYSVDVLGLGYQRGDSITFGVFIVIVDQYYNTYGYIDNVRWGTP
jgi:hypothetical protein